MTAVMRLMPIVIADECSTHIEEIEEQYRKVLICEGCDELDVYLRMCKEINLPLNQICPFKVSICPLNKW
jgi:hypothetical protein